jgi:hypothetical protein
MSHQFSVLKFIGNTIKLRLTIVVLIDVKSISLTTIMTSVIGGSGTHQLDMDLSFESKHSRSVFNRQIRLIEERTDFC